MKIYYAHIENYDSRFFELALEKLPPQKQEAIRKIKHKMTAQESILGWTMVFEAFKKYSNIEPQLVFSENGKPYFENTQFYFNISHSDGTVCAAVAKCEIGIDVQRIKPASLAMKNRVLSSGEFQAVGQSDNPDERFIDFWSKKESYLKYTGQGIAQDLKKLDFSGCAENGSFVFRNLNFNSFFLEECKVTVCSEDKNIDLIHFEQA